MNAIAISGGSTKVSFLAGAAIKLHETKSYDIYTGISAGSIISLMLAIGEYELLKSSIFDTEQKDFFDVMPTNNEGHLTLKAIFRVITGKESLGKYALGKLLKKYYTPQMHEKMKASGKIVKIGAANLNYVRIEYCDITKVDYETAILWVVASSSIPLATEFIKIGDCYYSDGGVFEHVGGIEAINSGATDLDVIFSRPEEMEISHEDINWKPENVLNVGLRVLNCMSRKVSFENEDEIKLTCDYKKIPYKMYYTPFQLTTSLYKMDHDLSRSWFQLGYYMAS